MGIDIASVHKIVYALRANGEEEDNEVVGKNTYLKQIKPNKNDKHTIQTRQTKQKRTIRK